MTGFATLAKLVTSAFIANKDAQRKMLGVFSQRPKRLFKTICEHVIRNGGVESVDRTVAIPHDV
jgi:hypothetical protein